MKKFSKPVLKIFQFLFFWRVFYQQQTMKIKKKKFLTEKIHT